MLVLNDSSLLGDKRVDRDMREHGAQKLEETKRQIEQYKVMDQAVLEQHDMAQGRMLSWTEFARKLSKANPTLLVEQGGVFGALAIRRVVVNEIGEIEKEYLSGFYMEPLPEYSSVVNDKMGLPVGELRGWRTVLNHLIERGALTQKQADKEFGPATGQRSDIWNRKSWERRNVTGQAPA